MNQQEMHIAIAEWMGWTDCCDGLVGKPPTDRPELSATYKPIPSLTLDWLHECEKMLTPLQTSEYMSIMVPEEGFDWELCHATKAQRLEALCRTLWPERFEAAQPEVRK